MSSNLNRQLEQSEKNLRLQLLYPDHKEAINALWSILHQDIKSYRNMSKSLLGLLEKSPIGYALPYEIQKMIRDEMTEVEEFMRKNAIELGMVSPEQEEAMIESYDDWFSGLDLYEQTQIEEKEIYMRFLTRLKEQIRKYMSLAE